MNNESLEEEEDAESRIEAGRPGGGGKQGQERDEDKNKKEDRQTCCNGEPIILCDYPTVHAHFSSIHHCIGHFIASLYQAIILSLFSP
jgi:hypothetical protein